MASKSLSDFSAELILQIYESFDDHHTITDLNLTSRKFYEIWQLNTALITEAVLPRAIDCFDLAQELLTVQGQSSRASGGQVKSHAAVLEWSGYLVDHAARMLKDYTSNAVWRSRCQSVDRRGRLEFTQSHYRVWILVELFRDRVAQDLRLQAATSEELCGMTVTVERLRERVMEGEWWGLLRMFRCGFDDFKNTFDMISDQFELQDSLSSGSLLYDQLLEYENLW